LKKTVPWMLLFLLLAPGWDSAASTQNGSDFIESTAYGVINWSQCTVQSYGIGTPDQKQSENTPEIAVASARQAAHENMLRLLLQLRVDQNRIVFDISKKDSGLATELMRMGREAREIRQEQLSDKTVKVVMELNLLGAFSQLILPPELKQIEIVKPIVPQENLPAPFTGLIVDATGIDVKPALVPKIVDESRKEVFGSAFASRESAVQQGMCRYVPDLASARKQERVGNHPLVVKGLKTEEGEKTTIVISTADAAKIKSASEHLQLLRKCAVIIVTDSKKP